MEKIIMMCNTADDEIFKKQCEIIQNKYDNFISKKSSLDDVGGSEIVTFSMGERDVEIFNDKVLNGIYVKANFDLESAFKR